MTLRSFLSGLWRGLDALRKALHLILLLVIFGVLLGILRGSVPRIPAKAALLVAPEGQLVEQLSGDPLERALQQTRGETHRETLLWDLTDSIRAAANDPRIAAVALDLEKFEGGTQPTLEEFAAALREFHASGKKVIAYGTELTQERYYLAAQADEVLLDPMGFVLIDGYDRYRHYLKDVLDKLGVEINVFRVGSFKSAVETFTRMNMSPEDREESRGYLNALWSSYQGAVTRARKLPSDALEKYVDSLSKTVPAAGGDAARVALQASLVSSLKTRIEFEQRLIGLVGKDDDTSSFKAVAVDDYVRYAHAQKKLKAGGKPRVGVIVAEGDILDGDQPPGSIGGDTIARLIRQASTRLRGVITSRRRRMRSGRARPPSRVPSASSRSFRPSSGRSARSGWVSMGSARLRSRDSCASTAPWGMKRARSCNRRCHAATTSSSSASPAGERNPATRWMPSRRDGCGPAPMRGAWASSISSAPSTMPRGPRPAAPR